MASAVAPARADASSLRLHGQRDGDAAGVPWPPAVASIRAPASSFLLCSPACVTCMNSFKRVGQMRRGVLQVVRREYCMAAPRPAQRPHERRTTVAVSSRRSAHVLRPTRGSPPPARRRGRQRASPGLAQENREVLVSHLLHCRSLPFPPARRGGTPLGVPWPSVVARPPRASTSSRGGSWRART